VLFICANRSFFYRRMEKRKSYAAILGKLGQIRGRTSKY